MMITLEFSHIKRSPFIACVLTMMLKFGKSFFGFALRSGFRRCVDVDGMHLPNS